MQTRLRRHWLRCPPQAHDDSRVSSFQGFLHYLARPPAVVVILGLRRRCGTRAKPDARAISMTAVLPSPMTPH